MACRFWVEARIGPIIVKRICWLSCLYCPYLMFWHFINTTVLPLGRYKASSTSTKELHDTSSHIISSLIGLSVPSMTKRPITMKMQNPLPTIASLIVHTHSLTLSCPHKWKFIWGRRCFLFECLASSRTMVVVVVVSSCLLVCLFKGCRVGSLWSARSTF